MHYSISIRQLVTCIVFSIAVVYTPWELIAAGEKFPDIENYVNNISLISSTINSSDNELFALLFSEPAWQLALLAIYITDSDPIPSLQAISLACSICISLYVVARTKNIYTLFFLFNPLFIDLVISQTRSALALSFCLIALSLKSRVTALILTIFATLTHSAALVGVVIFLIATTIRGKSSGKQITAIFSTSALIALALSVGRSNILGFLGDRRAEYDVETGSLLYVAYWSIIGTLIAIELPRVSPEKQREAIVAISLLTIPFITNILDTNGVRFLALALPFLIAAISGIPPSSRMIFYSIIPPYQTIQFIYWLRS